MYYACQTQAMESDSLISNTDEGTNAEENPPIPVRPRPRLPVRPSSLVTALLRPPRLRNGIINHLYARPTRPIEHTYEPTVNLTNFEFARNNVFNPWLSTAVRNEILARHYLYKPSPTQWAMVMPRRRFERFYPRRENNYITTFAVFRNYLLIGFNYGQISLFDLSSMCTIRSYCLRGRHRVTQIVVGKKTDRFFVISANEFTEFSYEEDSIKYRFACPFAFRKILFYDYPMLIVDSAGGVYEYIYENDLMESIVLKVEGLNLEELSFIQELKSFDPHMQEKTRPCLIKKGSCIAVVDITINSNQKMTLFRKEMLSTDPNENPVICCHEEYFFYSFISNNSYRSTNYIYVSKLKDIRTSTRVDMIKVSSALQNIKCSGGYLIALIQNMEIELYDAVSHIKQHQISFNTPISDILIIRNTILSGTRDGAMIIETLKMDRDQVCEVCANPYHFETNRWLRRCKHHIPQERVTAPFSIEGVDFL